MPANKVNNILLMMIIAACLSSCASNSIQPVGELGPAKLRVFMIKNNDFLSASRMLVVTDKKGKVLAYSGNTVAGTGPLAVSAADTVVTAGAMIAGAKAIQSGLQNTQVKGVPNTFSIKGIPHKVTVNTDSKVSINN